MKKLIFDSNDYIENEDMLFIEDDLDYLLSENIVKRRGEILGWIFISKRSSRYGSICNNGQTGFAVKNIPNLTKAILSIDSDRIIIKGSEGELKVSYYDHDGSHNCILKPITKSRFETVERIKQDYNKMIDYAANIPSVKIKR